MASVVTVVRPESSERTAIVNGSPPERELSHFARGLERWRAELGMGVNAFADYLGVSRSYYSLLRRGLRPPTMALAMRVLRERPDLAYTLPADAATFEQP